MNNIILCNLGQDRRKGNGSRVLVADVLDRSLFGNRDDICLFPRSRQPAFAKGGFRDLKIEDGSCQRWLLEVILSLEKLVRMSERVDNGVLDL